MFLFDEVSRECSGERYRRGESGVSQAVRETSPLLENATLGFLAEAKQGGKNPVNRASKALYRFRISHLDRQDTSLNAPSDSSSDLTPDSSPLDIYCIAIGGTGMAPLACLLQELGHRVRGSDGPLYPPMSTLLEEAGIRPLVGYDPEHLDPAPELVIVGNAVPRHNVEAETVEGMDVERISMPQALYRFFLAQRQPLVVAGTHGKTTTTSLAAWVYTHCDGDPGYLIGGVPKNFDRSFRIGRGPRFVIEGDEYNAAYFDRGPKFLHYRPQTLILTSVEHDHADLYPEPEDMLDAFRSLVRTLPADGLLVACGDTDEVRRVASQAPCRVVFYGMSERNDVYPLASEMRDGSLVHSLRDIDGSAAQVQLTMPGEHNLCNAIAVWVAARTDGYSASRVAEALAAFRGVKRRLDTLGTAREVTVVDDFAHHPTAVEKSIQGLRQAFGSRRLVVLFEPRSLTAGRSFFFDAYRQAFVDADEVIIAPTFHRDRLGDAHLDFHTLSEELTEMGTSTRVAESTEDVLNQALGMAQPGDVMVTMSSGSFEGMPYRLLEELQRVERRES